MKHQPGCGIDLIGVVVCMFIGGVVGGFTTQGLPLEARVAIWFAAVLAAAVVGFGLCWMLKNSPPREDIIVPGPRRQVAGSHCAGCQEFLLLASDGQYCEGCGKIFCRKCRPGVECPCCPEQPVVAELVDECRNPV